jgi:hypothetical protein
VVQVATVPFGQFAAAALLHAALQPDAEPLLPPMPPLPLLPPPMPPVPPPTPPLPPVPGAAQKPFGPHTWPVGQTPPSAQETAPPPPPLELHPTATTPATASGAINRDQVLIFASSAEKPPAC